MIYIIVGKSCSGKTLMREYLEKKGFKGFEASSFVELAMNKYNLNLEDLYKKFGKDFVSKQILKQIKGGSKSDIAISGLRTIEELNYFKKNTDAKVIGIYTSDKECFRRTIKRKREDFTNDFFNFFSKKICSDYELGLSKILGVVDIWIENDLEDIDKFYKEVDNLIKLKGAM